MNFYNSQIFEFTDFFNSQGYRFWKVKGEDLVASRYNGEVYWTSYNNVVRNFNQSRIVKVRSTSMKTTEQIIGKLPLELSMKIIFEINLYCGPKNS